MKGPAEVVTDVRRRLRGTWATDAAQGVTSWPHAVPLGKPSKADLSAGYTLILHASRDLKAWADQHGLTVQWTNRVVAGTIQSVPTHVVIPDQATAARVAADGWTERLRRGQGRFEALRARITDKDVVARLLRRSDTYTERDFLLLLDVADWFDTHKPHGLTPRQVPVPGVHAKWIDAHTSDLLTLTGRDSLGLLPRHPARIHFTYLDPAHLAEGGRLHDSATVGDSFTPPYLPAVVVISENKDTAIHFPPVPSGIAVEGDGFGGRTAAAFPWLTGAETLVYWGDIDAQGYEILNGWRADGVAAMSILMGQEAYAEYEPYGTNDAPGGRTLYVGEPKPLPHLHPDEQAVYERLVSPGHRGHRRVEQERIPLARAVEEVRALMP